MAANRKLLAEVQQVMKKVEEGVLIFDEVWDKVYSATQQSLKEKYEADLKKEIKKLQRLRDQIKTWISSSEIKDKNALLEARKTIESKMEQFKICEKDTKTKAFSKEGLAREAKLDPKEVLKEEKRVWINDCLERLSDLVNSVEADKEKLTSGKGKPTKAVKEQIEKADKRLIKLKWHETRLELIIKLMDNDDLDPSLLDGVKDSLDYYLESAAEDDGATGVEDEFDIYEDLNLDSIVPDASNLDEIAKSVLAASVVEEETKKEEAAEDAKAKAKAAAAAPATKPVPVPAAPVPVKTLPAGKTAAAVVAGTSSTTPPSLTPSASKPPALTQTKPTDKKSGATPVSLAAIVAASSGSSSAPSSEAAEVKSEEPATTPAPAPVSWATAAAAATQPKETVQPAKKEVLVPPPTPPQPSITVTAQPTPVTMPALTQPVPTKATVPASPVVTSINANTTAPTVSPAPSVTSVVSPTVGSTVNVPSASPVVSVPAPSAALSSQPSLPPLQQKISPEMMSALNMLKYSMVNAPESLEAEKLPSYTPRNHYSHPHPTYPVVPLFATHAENAAWFERLPMDTLFFVFYFQQGTYQQFLAARQLKKHSWRFHKKYMTWFQRHEEPKIATEEYEEGTYVYFDYESGWCQRIKSEFKFEYAYLEDELSGMEA